jgi:hypothetical protein
MIRPVALGLSENDNVEWLELVCAFRRKCDDNDVMLVRELPESIGFMRVVAVQEENDGVGVHLVGSSKGDECLLEPLGAKLVVCPPIWRRCDCPDRDIRVQVEKRGDGSI